MTDKGSNAHRLVLVVNSGPYHCALPLASVAETMRPLPIRSFAQMPAFVDGASIIRGVPVPVVHLARLLGSDAEMVRRFVVIRVGERQVALAVEAVLGVENLQEARLTSVPPLLQRSHPDIISALAAADERLLVVLNSAWMLPEGVWEALDRGRG